MIKPSETLPRTSVVDPDAAWRAVVARDRRYDGRFVYAVSSTRVYCQASCPSRRPLRANVELFASPAEAASAGYRPCKRCRPDAADRPEDAIVERMRLAIDERGSTPISLSELARETGTTPSRAQRLFTKAVGITPKEYQDAVRARRFREHLRAGETVSRATYEAGYGSSSRVYEKDPAILGMTPSTFRRGGRGMHIQYAIAESPLGTLLVAFTERGVCAVSLGDDAQTREAELRAEFPHAEIDRADDSDHAWVHAVLARVSSTAAPSSTIPLDVAGTAFQWRVWKELQRIPAGRTRSYRDVAIAIGRPTAARAVARACATNPVAVVIPCHRVVRGDGALGGYRWGLERKVRLLDREKSDGA